MLLGAPFHVPPSSSSESMVIQVTVDVLEAVVPVEHEVAPAEAPQALDAEVHDLLEMPREQVSKGSTYFLPVGTLRGLTSSLLKWAKTSSQGAAS
jgi:hypothetical protein